MSRRFTLLVAVLFGFSLLVSGSVMSNSETSAAKAQNTAANSSVESPTVSASSLFLAHAKRLAKIACSQLPGEESRRFVAEVTNSPQWESMAAHEKKSAFPAQRAAQDEPHSFTDQYCTEDSTAILAFVEIAFPKGGDRETVALITYDRVPELPIGFQDSLSLTVCPANSASLASYSSVRITVIANRSWRIEEEALFGVLSPRLGPQESSERVHASVDDLISYLFVSDLQSRTGYSRQVDISDLIELLDSTFKRIQTAQ